MFDLHVNMVGRVATGRKSAHHDTLVNDVRLFRSKQHDHEWSFAEVTDYNASLPATHHDMLVWLCHGSPKLRAILFHEDNEGTTALLNLLNAASVWHEYRTLCTQIPRSSSHLSLLPAYQ